MPIEKRQLPRKLQLRTYAVAEPIVMKFVIEKRGDQWCVLTEDKSRTLGCHATKAEAEAQLAAVEISKAKGHADGAGFYSIPDVEIFRSGKWKGDAYSLADLDAMVAAYPKVGFVPPVTLDHKDEGPAYGWIKNLRRVGSKLVADFVDMTREVYDAIKSRKLGPVSSEIAWNYDRGGTVYPRVLRAVSLLGAKIPAVAGLQPAFQNLSEQVVEDLRMYDVKLLQEPVAGVATTTVEVPDQIRDATGDPPTQVKQVGDQFCLFDATGDPMAPPICFGTQAQAEAALQELQEAEHMDDKEKKQYDDKIAGLEAQLTKLQGNKDLSRLQTLENDLGVARAELAALHAERQTDKVAVFIDKQIKAGKVTPAQKGILLAVFSGIDENREITFAVDGKEEKLGVGTLLRRYVESMPTTIHFGEIADGDKASAAQASSVGSLVHARVLEYAEQHKLDPIKDYSKALRAVLDADPGLKAEYLPPGRA
jgi:hypothetical protein